MSVSPSEKITHVFSSPVLHKYRLWTAPEILSRVPDSAPFRDRSGTVDVFCALGGFSRFLPSLYDLSLVFYIRPTVAISYSAFFFSSGMKTRPLTVLPFPRRNVFFRFLTSSSLASSSARFLLLPAALVRGFPSPRALIMQGFFHKTAAHFFPSPCPLSSPLCPAQRFLNLRLPGYPSAGYGLL